MPKKQLPAKCPATQINRASPLPSITAEAALSFLKDTKGATTWSVRDLTDVLKISRRDAEQVIALLAAQGYVQSASAAGEWMTTPSGESVSGAKSPRFTRESVEQAIESLKERIKQVNQDLQQAFRITDAIAFGDFLLKDRTRVQAADVAIGMTPRGEAGGQPGSVPVARAERQFLRQLCGRTALLYVRLYADWMSKRSHVNLL